MTQYLSIGFSTEYKAHVVLSNAKDFASSVTKVNGQHSNGLITDHEFVVKMLALATELLV